MELPMNMLRVIMNMVRVAWYTVAAIVWVAVWGYNVSLLWTEWGTIWGIVGIPLFPIPLVVVPIVWARHGNYLPLVLVVIAVVNLIFYSFFVVSTTRLRRQTQD
jgi:hypothetical protein